MALYQPTNVIPSSYTKGTVDVNDTMEISWQVNGNSAMTAFQIDFYLNDASSTLVVSTGKLPKTDETQAQYGLPFYGTDRFGRPQFFTWNPSGNLTWANWSANKLTNGNEYKYKITQFYNEGSAEQSVVQTAFSSFITRANPTLTLSTTASDFVTDKKSLTTGSSLSTSIGYFVADYSQAQGVPIRWIKWQVATATYNTQTEKWVLGEILADTGDIYTPTLNYEFNGFFNGQQYAIRATGESESGQECTSDWIYFTINIENQGEYSGDFTVQFLNKENATLLEWEGVEYIAPTVTPSTYTPTLNNGSVTLAPNTQISWSQSKENEVVPFNSPWTTVYKAKVGDWQTATSVFRGTTAPYGEVARIPVLTISGITGTDATGTPPLVYYKYTTTIVFPSTPTGAVDYIQRVDTPAFGEASIDNVGHTLTLTLYSTHPNTSVSGNFTLYYAETYQVSVTKTFSSDIKSVDEISYGANVKSVDYTINDRSITMIIQSNTNKASVNVSVNMTQWSVSAGTPPNGNLLLITTDSNSVILSRTSGSFELKIGNNTPIPIEIIPNSKSVAILISPLRVVAFCYSADMYLGRFLANISLSNWQEPITLVSIFGGDSGATIESVSVYNNQMSTVDIRELYDGNPDFEPVWNATNYTLYMTANFNGNLEGGTGTTNGAGFRIYRQELGKNILTPIATVPSMTTSLKDYGISSRKYYKYSLYAYDSNGSFMNAVESEKIIATNFTAYSLLVCDYDQDKDEYHVRKQYLFQYNLGDGSVSNNNNPTFNANFTRYPTRMPSTQNYASGVLTGLIGVVYTVPALVEQIGNYKVTTRPTLLDYFDSVELERELYDLSTAPYQLFLRDMKGRLRMIHTNSALSMTTNIKQQQQSISISFPWAEIGDASNVTIIQTPDDYGWNNDNQVLDVSLNVDVATGELYATYPFPYNGTKFYLTGANKETLTAKTPLGVTPAQFKLSETATQPDDGELNATVKVNSEETK